MLHPTRAPRHTIVTVLSIAALVGLATPAVADWPQRQKITSTPRGVGAQFGNAVAINGSTMVVGARFDSTTASQAGAAVVYILNGTTWTQQAKLLANDGASGDKFGYSVAVGDDTIVVGAYNDDGTFADTGSAYVFVRSGTTWTQQQKLMAGDGTAADEFGNAVGIQGEVIAVGAHFADLPSNAAAGAVYLFQRNGTAWTSTQKLVPIPGLFPVPGGPVSSTSPNFSPILGDHFGESIAMNGGKMAVGAATSDLPATSAGAVYVFAGGGGGNYALQQKLIIPDGTNGDFFGCSVALEATTLVGGAREDAPAIGKTAYGAAYVFELSGSTWTPQGKLTATDGASFDRFGWSVAVAKDIVAVGAREDDTPVGPDAGSAYVFVRSGTAWTQQQKLAPNDKFNGDRFGASVAFGAKLLVVGAAEKSLAGPNGQGAAYTFVVSTTSKSTRFDYDGDGKADLSVFRPANGQWLLQQSADSVVRNSSLGLSTHKPVPADYDGDGITDIATFYPSTGMSTGFWTVTRSSNSNSPPTTFGMSTDIPVPADFDGDGKADIAVFRPSNGDWFINRTSGGMLTAPWGLAGDIPVPADYDGDGKADLAVFRPANGSWHLRCSTAGDSVVQFGLSSDKPVPADYTGDGKTDIAVWRPSSGTWHVLRSEDSSFFGVPFGANGDTPVPADYDGDGKADFAVFRSDGWNWYVQRSTAGMLIQQFGQAGDKPTPAAFIP